MKLTITPPRSINSKCFSFIAMFIILLFGGRAMAENTKTTADAQQNAVTPLANETTTGPWAEWNPTTTTLTFYYGERPSDEEKEKKTGWKFYEFDENSIFYTPEWVDKGYGTNNSITDKLTKVVFDKTFANAKPHSCFWWFSGASKLKTIEGLEYLNTSEVQQMAYMFAGCTSLTELDLTNFVTYNVISDDDDYIAMRGFANMFYGCTNLKHIYANSFNAQGIKYPANMFEGCTSLEGAVKYDEKNANDHTFANYKTGYFSLSYTVGGKKQPIAGEPLKTADMTLTDGEDFVSDYTFTADKATYTRQMNNKWGTLCLPYAFSTDDNATADFYTMKQIDESTLSVTKLSGTIAAGTPVIVCKKSTANEISVNATGTEVVKEPATTDNLVGTFAEQDVPDNAYIIGNNKFWLASSLKTSAGATAVKTKGLRAYIAPASTHNAQATLNIVADNDVTAIDTLNAAADGTAECYDILGRRTNSLHNGINIVKKNGVTRKIIIK